MLSCSKKMKVKMVWGPNLKKYGVNPFHKLKNPSFFTVFERTSKGPLYSGTPLMIRIVCTLVFAMSMGMLTTVERNPEMKLAVK